MKKLFATLLTIALLASIVTGCASTKQPANSTENNNQNQQETQTPADNQNQQETQTPADNGNNNQTPAENGNGDQTTTAPENGNDSQPPADNGNDTQTPDNQQETMGAALLNEFRTQIDQLGSDDLTALAEAILANERIEFSPAQSPVEPGYLTGFPEKEITGFAEGVMFGPMIGTIPFVGYLFRLDNGADVDAFCDMLKENADLRWNICTSADEMILDQADNVVFFLMCPSGVEG